LINSELKEQLTDTIALLNISGVGTGRFNRLVSAIGTPSEVLSSSINELDAVPGISRALACEIKKSCDVKKAQKITVKIIQLGWDVLIPSFPEYPSTLLNIPNYPPLLFRMGNPLQDDDKLLAIVGTRHCTERSRRFTIELASTLAQAGIIVVSGMAEGIDSAAHKGALAAGGQTIAIWGNSLDIVYPTSNKGLSWKIKKNGAIYSEYLPETTPTKTTFPERNRIISGLCEGVIVVEAGKKSGALITAHHALEQERQLFAVPGSPFAKMSQGTNELIKNGARLTTSIDDIFEELPRLKGEIIVKKFRQLPDLTETEKKIVSIFSEQTLQIDQIARTAEMPVKDIMSFLLALEMKGVIRELSGKRFILSEDYV